MRKHLIYLLDISPAIAIVSFICIVIVAYLGRASAAETPSRAALRIVDQIKANQEVIDQTREAHMQFMAAKDANIFSVGQLSSLCYSFDWTNMAPTKIEDCTPDFQ